MLIPYLMPDKKFDLISDMLDDMPKQKIDIINWPDFRYAPEVDFSMAWNESNIYLKYTVKEEVTRAVTTEDNGPVWKDSCVEFFVSPGRDEYYYNFEFNCLGVCLLGYGNSRKNREFAPLNVLSGIIRRSTLGQNPFQETASDNPWSLFIRIPTSAFFRHPGLILGKYTISGNFYKCGDGLSKPHYLSWCPVHSPTPDFHRPEYFNSLDFEI